MDEEEIMDKVFQAATYKGASDVLLSINGIIKQGVKVGLDPENIIDNLEEFTKDRGDYYLELFELLAEEMDNDD